MKYAISSIASFLLSVLFSVLLIPALKTVNVRQTILSYVEEHKNKNGTPTMGGLIFIIPIFAVFLAMSGITYTKAFVCLVIALSGGIIGFLDDYIKVRCVKNQGLKAWQKIVFQTISGIALSLYAYAITNGELFLPFSNRFISIGAHSVVLNFIAYIALINTVNLTDGLDGLAVSTSGAFMIGFALILTIIFAHFSPMTLFFEDVDGINLLLTCSVGGLLGYFLVNCYPANVFMGDTGSMFLGAMISSVCIVSGMTLLIPVLGIVFVISGLSDILQVGYFKITKGKRIFKMAPFHHHLQQSGMHENKIVVLYFVITVVAFLIVALFLLKDAYGLFI